MLPRININRNSAVVFTENAVLHFSYETLISFKIGNNPLVISENCWSTTTGKHLNEIDSDKSKRVPRKDFMRLYEEQSKELV